LPMGRNKLSKVIGMDAMGVDELRTRQVLQ